MLAKQCEFIGGLRCGYYINLTPHIDPSSPSPLPSPLSPFPSPPYLPVYNLLLDSSAQRNGLLSEASDVDIADPFFAYCKQHANKATSRTKRRNWMALQGVCKKSQQLNSVSILLKHLQVPTSHLYYLWIQCCSLSNTILVLV